MSGQKQKPQQLHQT